MATALSVRVLIGDSVVQLRYSNRALYRIGILDKPLALSDIAKPKRGLAALSQWLWACLDADDAKRFESPDDLAEALKQEQFADAANALREAIAAANPPAKNADSSTPKPSPASS